MFSVYEYVNLDTRGVEAALARTRAALAAGDFAAAQVRKLAAASRLPLYRARLSDADRLLFTLVRCGENAGVLLLEVIRRHAYDKSRFLRGAEIDEAKIVEATAEDARAVATPLRYLHPQRSVLQLLDKPLSFDDAQQAVFEQPAPMIVVGSAGSGKTALTLERLKQMPGEVLYVTQSAFLARSARDLYFAHGFERADQETSFLSYQEFLETLRVPKGQEASWKRFAAWFARQRLAFPGLQAHQAFEEIRGVIVAAAEGVLDRATYRQLGVRQSIYAGEQREQLYSLFERYRAWLGEEQLYDLNLLAHERLPLAAPRYDFVVIDEVQDLTPVQLALVLRCLGKPGQFLLCGDSNQIVHPNFFSWSQVKTLFWRDAELGGRQQLRVLGANFRNATETTRLANSLLKVKHARFGSIDRESNFLVEAVGADPGGAVLLPDREAPLRQLDRQSRASTEVAVLVMREEDKPAARQRFATPLLFSVQEAKGLEYPNIILYRFISDHRAEFAAIAEGVAAEDLDHEQLDYRRARDKQDKSAEVYKFYVNALYVALTRAVRNVYLVESDHKHPLLGLLGIGASETATVQARNASREDWQREAHRLEQQGKLEQAEAIRRDVLREQHPPWTPLDESRLRELLVKVFRDRAPGGKLRQQILDHAALVDAPDLAEIMGVELHHGSREAFERQRPGLVAKALAPYAGRNFKDVLRQCEQFGVDYRSPLNFTPLMAAAVCGNLPLVDALLERGADLECADDYGHTALHWVLREAFQRADFAHAALPALYERLAPSAIDLQAGDRLLRIDRRISEYLLVQTLWTLLRGRFTRVQSQHFDASFDSASVLQAWRSLPAAVLRPERNKRSFVSALLSRNEVERDYAYNRALFQRVGHGRYSFNPALQVRRAKDAGWQPLLQHLNLGLINELVISRQSLALQALARRAGLETLALPIVLEQSVARQEAERLRLQEAQAQQRPQQAPRQQALQHGRPRVEPEQPRDPPWSSPEARALALRRLIARNVARRRGKPGGDEGSGPR
jgi:hypothetical protein